MITDSNIKQRPIYFDYHATTPMDPRVATRMLYYMTEAFGNASSTDHPFGDEAEAAVTVASRQVATLLGTSSRNVIFTSGATESINLALQGHCAAAGRKQRIALSPLEHKAVLDTCQALEKQEKAELSWLGVDRLGKIDLAHVKEICQSGVDLLCVMAANNEIGNIYPVQKIAEIAADYGAIFLCDATQAVGKIPIKFDDWNITYLALSAHKIYGPKGCGALIIQPDACLSPLIYGGGHQKGLRSGTLNVPGIVGLGEACKLRLEEMESDEEAIRAKRDQLLRLLQVGIPDLILNGDTETRLAGNLHISIPSVPNSAIIAHIRHKLAISTGSACSSGIEAPSHVLKAIHLDDECIEGALRISIGKFTTDKEIIEGAKIVTNAIAAISKSM
jgi:cysteine desulfurase